jgi:hypothetical protein
MRLGSHVLVGVVFLGLVTFYTWPLMRAPSDLPAPQDDPCSRLYILVTHVIARNLLTHPGDLLQGTAFYPLGNSITLAEPLLTPALLVASLAGLTHDAVLAFKVALVLFWAVSGWAMYAVTFWLTRHHPAALVGALIFVLCPARILYYGEFQIEMAFGVPLAVYALVRFLEEQRLRHLATLLVVFWMQAVAVVYYGVILGLGLAVVAAQYVALRWSCWRLRTLVAAALGSAALALALLPVARPYFVTRQELGLERGLDEAFGRSADLLTYVSTDGTWLARPVPIRYVAETPLFVGLSALGLAVVSLAWLRGDGQRVRGRAERWLAAGVWVCLTLTILLAVAGRPIRVGSVRSAFSTAGVALLVLALARHGAEGWERWRQDIRDRRLTDRDWVGSLLVLIAFAVLLSLGPEARVAHRPLGGGLYAWLYPYLLPLHAIRGATRIGLLVVFATALLAAFGLKWLSARLPAWGRRAAAVAATLLMLLEFGTVRLPYAAVATRPRAVDAAIRADPDDVAVLEWPANVPGPDADAMFRSVDHGKRVVNGYAGFPIDLLEELSGLLTTPGTPFPVPEAQAALRRIYPVRYLVVRLADPGLLNEWRPVWLALRQTAPPLLRFRGTFGNEDLYEIVPLPERGVRVERWVSYGFVRDHPVLDISLRPLRTDRALEQWVDIDLNRRRVGRVPLDGVARATVTLARPFFEAAPNVIGLKYRYRRLPAIRDARYRIGGTGVVSPGDLRVVSAGQPQGSSSSIQLDGVELAPDHRGYNLVALSPRGELVAADVFDTFLSAEAAHRLAAWIRALPTGTIVAGAVRDEGSGQLTADAVGALRTLGVAGDLRGHFREAQAFVGVTGAPPGSALEALGPRVIELVVGHPEMVAGQTGASVGFELTAFALHRG